MTLMVQMVLTLVIASAAGVSVALLMQALDTWLERHYYQ